MVKAKVKLVLPFDKQPDREVYKLQRGFSSPMGPHYKRFATFKTINTSITKYPNQDLSAPFDKTPSRLYYELRD